MEQRWEDIGKGPNSSYMKSDRLKVPGGWIVRSYGLDMGMNAKAATVHQIFVSDHKHEWKL